MHKQPKITMATRKRIMDSFWEMYKHTPIDKITVSAISKRAGIHRSTFYEYFKDTYDLLEQMETDFLGRAKNHIAQSKKSSIPMDIHDFIDSTFAFYTEHGEFLYYLLGPSGDPAFRRKILESIKPEFIDKYNIPLNSPYADYLISYVFTVIANSLVYWIEHKDTITPEEVIAITYQLINNGIQEVSVP